MLVYHIVYFSFSKERKKAVLGAVIGIIASTLGIIAVLGMILHWAAFICLLIDGILSFNEPTDHVAS